MTISTLYRIYYNKASVAGVRRKGRPLLAVGSTIGLGAKIFGLISIGDDIAIGANAVVAKCVPHKAVFAGIPARIISYKTSSFHPEYPKNIFSS